MVNLQTIDPANIWATAKTLLGWLATLGIVIDLTPGLKFQPVRWLLSQLGNLINADIKKQLDGLQKDFTEFKVDAWRTEILDFSDTCMNHQRHTKEQFDHVIKLLDKYDDYITYKKMKNGQVDVAHEYILEIYRQCMRDNDFALDEEDEKARKKAAEEARSKRTGGEDK